MAALFRFMDWPLRAKMAVLLVVASSLPLGIATWISIQNAREQLYVDAAAQLSARSDQLVGRIDTFNRSYTTAVKRMALLPAAMDLVLGRPQDIARLRTIIAPQLNMWPISDTNIRGVGVLDATGTVQAATETRLVGVNLSTRSFVKKALTGKTVVSDLYLGAPEVGSPPTIAFLAPMFGPDRKQVGIAAFWVHATAVWDMVRESNDQVGPGSFAVVFDDTGVRVAHSLDQSMVFLPGQPLAPAAVDAMVAENRFGARTREILMDVRDVSGVVPLDSSDPAVRGMVHGYSPANKQWNYAVGRRFSTADWTVFFSVPDTVLHAQISRIVREKLWFAGLIIVLALVAGTLFSAVILRPIRSLSSAAQEIAAGNADARAITTHTDELGQLGVTFNNMAARLQEQALALRQKSEAQYRGLFESLLEGFTTVEVILDAEGRGVDFRYIEVNTAFERQTGLRDVQGKTMRELVPNHEDYWFRILGQVAVTGESMHFENEAKELGRYYDVHAYRVGGPESRRVVTLFNDITGRKAAQHRLQSQLERLSLLQQVTRAIGERQDLPSIFQVVVRTLEDRLPVDFACLCLYDPKENRLTVSRVGLGSYDLAMEMALSERSRFDIDRNGLSSCIRGNLVYEPDVTEVQYPFPQRLAKGGLRALVATPLLVENRVFGVLIAARREAGSFSSGECEFLRQLSEHVALAAHHAQLYSALQSAYEDLRQTQQAAMQQERLRALGQMASGIAHDINNAISPVALYTDSLLERETGISAAGRNQLQTIQRAIHDVAATVARMREFYRQREQQLTLAPVQLNELVPQIVDLTRAHWSTMPQQRGIRIDLRTELQPDLPVIMGAEGEIREALTNLVLNGVDAMAQGGTLTLRTRAVETGLVQLEVIDTGVGMDEDARRRCLEPFFTTKGERGTGLGLAMVYGMAQRHSADVEIDSEVGKGTTIRLRFGAATGVVATPEPVQFTVVTGLRILVVDDDPVLLRSLRDTLESDGHTVVTANGGEEGIEQFRAAHKARQGFSITITDLGMPYVDGRQVASTLKQLSPATPVVLLTGWGQRLVAEGDVPAHVDMVLSKPPKLRDLREALARFCGTVES